MKAVFYLIICILNVFMVVKSQTVDVHVNGLSNNRGQVRIAVFTSQSDFENEKPLAEKVFSKSKLSDGQLIVRFSLSPGVYGIALLDDENSDGEMKYNFLGIPAEGFGFSNFDCSGFVKPEFEDFCFRVYKGSNKVSIKVRYML